MANELKTTVINMKSLSQNIPDPVIVGAGDANGRTLRIIFTQEAAAQLTENTKIYLSWHHQEVDIKGYNVFTKIENDEDEDFPPTWEIKYPKSMLYEGNVLACIQLVDNVSIATSTNFMIHVLIDPNDGSRYTASDDFSEFQNAVIILSSLADEARNQMTAQKLEFEDMQLEFMDVRRIVNESNSISEEAKEIAEQSLTTAENALNTITDFTSLVQEVRNEHNQIIQDVTDLQERMENEERLVEAVNGVAQSALEIARAIEERGSCDCGVSEEDMNAAIAAAEERINSNARNDWTADIEQAKDDIISRHNQDLERYFTITEFI